MARQCYQRSVSMPKVSTDHIYSKPLTTDDPYSGCTAPLTPEVAFCIFIQQILVLKILNMVYTLRFFPLQNAVCFIILTYLIPVLFTIYIQGVLELKNNSGAKRVYYDHTLYILNVVYSLRFFFFKMQLVS